MKRRPSITVSIDSVNHSAFVAGFKGREYVINCGGRPIWSSRRKAWSTSEHTARDVLAMADGDGLTVHFHDIERDAR